MRMLRTLMMGCAGLPMPLRMGLLVVGGGGSIFMIMFMLRSFIGRSMWVILIGIAVVFLIVMAFRLLVKWARKRRSAPMERDIVGQSAAAPQGVSAASRRAALDDLRRNFETGVGKFRAAGKNLYSLPWYAIVGEPGSGKTEAVRHSCIGFPPGLHDALQGAGGTINMNWWFTDRAVILDTAGRLMFEEVEAGSTGEWEEFLKLLKTYRHNCPINGLFLVIPADTLITDTADQIKGKANKIAEQLHRIQRVLEVRFPVFVMITKCDLINGFREFFDDVTDPDLQQQILGWSNPAPLDERFNPETVSQHLETVCGRLRRRRLGLMIDPIHTDDPNGQRIEQVDALYALPQSLARIAPRLRHYLDHVFAGGEWTGKPLFLRGIYFTSSMREGSVLDDELAEALGVPVQSIQEGRQWERERSYFLKDMFLEKAFKEKGLVTRAANAGRQRRRRKGVVLAAGFISVLVLAVFTWFGVTSLRKSIGVHRDFWVTAADARNWRASETDPSQEYWRPIVALDHIGSTDYVYGGKTILEVGNDEVRLAEYHGKLVELGQQPIRVPWVFWLAQVGSTNLTENRDEAQRLIFERGVLRPLIDASRQKMMEDTPDWPTELTPALAELVRIEDPAGDVPDLEPLIQCALHRSPEKKDATEEELKTDKQYQMYRANYEEYLHDREPMDGVLKLMYEGDGRKTAREAVRTGSNSAYHAIDKGLERYLKYWVGRGQRAAKQLDEIIDLKELLLKDFKDNEQKLLEVDDEFTPRLERPTERKVDVIKDALAAWQTRLEDLYRVKTTTEAKLANFPDGPIYPVFEKTSGAIVKEVAEAFRQFRVQAGIASAPEAQPPETPAAKPETGQPAVPPKVGKAKEGAEKVAGAVKDILGIGKPTLEEKSWDALATKVNGQLDGALKRLESQAEFATVGEEVRRVDVEFLSEVEIAKALWERLTTDGLVKTTDGRSLRLYELRLMMYRLGDAERSKDDAAAQIGSFAKGIQGVEDRVTAACAGIDELKALKPEAFRFAEASTVSAFTARKLAMPQRIYRMLLESLNKAPKSEDEVAAAVGEASKALQAAVRPKIPLTNFKGGNFDAKYHPQAIVSIFRMCSEAGSALADEKRTVLEREKLKMMWQHWNAACNTYVAGPYLRYWTQMVPSDLASKGTDWKTFRQEVEGSDIFENFIAMGDVGKAMMTAMSLDIEKSLTGDAKQSFTASRETVQAQIRKLQNNIYQQKCRLVRSNWCKLGDDPFEARSRLAMLPLDEIFEGYLPFAYKTPEEFCDKYWTDLTYEALRLIIEGAGKLGQELYADLVKRYAQFPLDRPSEDGKALMPADVNAARKLVDRLVLRWQKAPTREPDAERAKSQRATVERMLEQLRSLRLTPGQWDWVSKLRGVLDGLPADDKALKCSIWISREQPARAVGLRWVHIRVKQGGREVGKGNTQPGTDYKLCEVWYPGEKLELRLYKNPVDPAPNRAVDVESPWALVRLLHPGKVTDPLYVREQFKHGWQAEAVGEKNELLDPKKRNIVLTVEDDQRKPRLLRLRLEFEKGLPRVEDWPSSQGR